MNCPKCNHEDYTVMNTTANTATVTFTITVPDYTSTTQSTVPTMHFHLDCQCCQKGHK